MNISVVDAFDLPEWAGIEPVTWRATSAIDEGARVEGSLRGAGDHELALDLLAVDVAYPRPVCPDAERTAAHRAWQFGEVTLLSVDGRLAAGIPANQLDTDLASEALRRFARAVGADSSNVTLSIRL